MLEYFIFLLMIIVGAAIIVFAIDKKIKGRSKTNYVDIASKGGSNATHRGRSYRHTNTKNIYSSEPKDKVDVLFSGEQENKRENYNKILNRRKNIQKNIKKNEIEIPTTAWGKKSNKKIQGNKKHPETKVKGKYGHLFSSGSTASSNKLAKLKMRAMEVYEEQYKKEKKPQQEENTSIFSLFGGENNESQNENRNEQIDPYHNPSNSVMDNISNNNPNHNVNGFNTDTFNNNNNNNNNNNSFMSSSPDVTTTMTEPVQSAPIPSFSEPMPEIDNNSFKSVPETKNEDFISESIEPQKDDEVTKDDAFNMMLGFDTKKDEKPTKKKEDREWTPMF